MALFYPVGVIAQVDRKEALKFMKRLMPLLEEKGLSVFLEPTCARVEKFEVVFSRFGDNSYQRLKSRLLLRGEIF